MLKFDNIKKMYLITFLSSLHFFGAVLVPMLTVWGGISFTEVMILQSIFMFSVTFFEIPTGAVADIWGRKASLALGFLVATVALSLYGFNKTFWSFALGEITLALATSLVSGGNTALLYDSLKEAHREDEADAVFGKFRSFSMLGIMLSGPIGSLLATRFGLIAPMRFTALTALFAFLIALTLKEPNVEKEQTSKSFRTQFAQLFVGVEALRRDSVLLELALDLSITVIVGKAMIWLYQPVLSELGVPIAYFGFISFVFVFVELVLMMGSGRIIKLLGSRERAFAISRVLPFVGMILLAASVVLKSSVGILLAVTGVILVIGVGLARKPYFEAPMNERITSEDRATVNSTINMISKGFLFVADPLIGIATDYSILIPLSAFVFLIGLWVWHKR